MEAKKEALTKRLDLLKQIKAFTQEPAFKLLAEELTPRPSDVEKMLERDYFIAEHRRSAIVKVFNDAHRWTLNQIDLAEGELSEIESPQ